MRIIFIMVCCICLALSTLVLAAEPVSLLAAAEGLRNADAQVRLTAVGQLFTLARGGNYQAALAMGSALPDTDIHVRNLARQYFENLSDRSNREGYIRIMHFVCAAPFSIRGEAPPYPENWSSQFGIIHRARHRQGCPVPGENNGNKTSQINQIPYSAT